MTKYIHTLILVTSLQVQAQIGVNTDDPKSNLHIVHTNENKNGLGIGIPNVYNFTNDLLDNESEGLLVYFDNQNLNNNGKEGFYYWDAEVKTWQYIFKSGTEKDNLFKTSARSNGILIQSTDIINEWYKSNFNYVDTNNPNFEITNGSLKIGRSGRYSVYYAGAAKKNQGDNNLVNVECGLFINNNQSPTIFAASSIPSSDYNYRVSSLNFSTILTLQKDDLLSFKFRKITTYNNSIYLNHSNHYLILTYLD